jgi:peptide/nickel transport system ATP-binding protein
MTPPLLEAANLSRHFHARSGAFSQPAVLKAVDGIDLCLHEGETLGIAGESGCGKSTAGKLLARLLEPTGGTVRFRGGDIADLKNEELLGFRKQVQMIFQDPFSSLNPRMRVGELVGEPLRIHRIASRSDYRDRVVRLMALVGLDEGLYNRYPHEFSGGQRQRIGIARSLAVSPRLIIADEPVSALDLSIQAQIINLMQELKREMSLSYLFIAHDLSVVRHMSDRVAIMYLGKIVETGTRDDVFLRQLHPYTEALLAAIPQTEPGGRPQRAILHGDLPSPFTPPAGCPFHTRCPYIQPVCRTEAPPLEEKESGHRAACHFSQSLFRR